KKKAPTTGRNRSSRCASRSATSCIWPSKCASDTPMVMMFWSYRVRDWDTWSASLMLMNEQDPQARERRERYGLQRRWVYRSVDDPSEVMMVAEFSSRE